MSASGNVQSEHGKTAEPERTYLTDRIETLYEGLFRGIIRGVRQHGRALIIGIVMPLTVIVSLIGIFAFAAPALLHHYTTHTECVAIKSAFEGEDGHTIVTDEHGKTYNLPDLKVSEQHQSTEYPGVNTVVTYTITKHQMVDGMFGGGTYSYTNTPRRFVITSRWESFSDLLGLNWPYSNRTITSIDLVPADTSCPS
jgi:hypothetical protein